MFPVLTLAALSQLPATPQAPPTPREAVFGEAPVIPVDSLGDDVPRPIPAQFKEGADGDELVAPASGDPFFLGFAAGRYYPPATERIDPALLAIAASAPLDGRPEPVTYAFVMFDQRMTDAGFEALKAAGARVLEFHPFYTVKVALPAQSIAQVADLDFVRWIGVAKSWQKLHPDLALRATKSAPQDLLDVYVNVFESDLGPQSTSEIVSPAYDGDPDGNATLGNEASAATVVRSNGWQQQALAELGLEVGAWVESIRAFHARVPVAALEALVAADFVQFVDLDFAAGDDHDEAMPLCNADLVRALYDGSTSGNCQAGYIDSGLYGPHAALDPWCVGWDFSGAGNPFDDTSGHGTHVAGTILGNDDVDDSYQGAAPGLGSTTARRFFVVRRGSGAPFSTWLAVMHSAYNDGTNTSAAPMVVSNSYSSNVVSSAYIGSESAPRTIDAEAYTHDQLWVWSASNEGPAAGTIGLESCAKNALTVGNVVDYEASVGDPGTIWSGSSRGPCGDNRWKPNLCAPGRMLYSCQAGTTSGYVNMGGTSMSTPLVSGMAAQLCDHYAFLRYNPPTLSAVMMAGTLTKDDQLLTSPSTSAAHLNAYGTGRLEGYKANFPDSQEALYFWGTTLAYNASTYVEFPVGAGATRVTVVVHYKEAACSAGASQALINDFDSYLDVEPFSAGNNTGDYSVQQSSVDNTEVRSINNPTAGDWRVKLWPASTVPTSNARVGICAIITYGDTTPAATLNVTANDVYVLPGDDVTLKAVYYNPNSIASGVFLDSSSSGDTLTASYNTLLDGSTADLMNNQHAGRDVCIGDVVHHSDRTHHWTTHWNTEGVKLFSVQARSDNAIDVSDGVAVYVDGTDPSAVTNLHSTTHTPNVWTNVTGIGFAWNAATDNVSGVDGYGLSVTTAPTLPGATKDIEQTQLTYAYSLLQGSSWYFNVRSVDNCGNWDDQYTSVGPFKIDTTAPSAASNLTSTTHQVNTLSCSTNVTMTWTAATDALSGLGGYIAAWNTSPSTTLSGSPTLGAGTTQMSQNIGSSASGRYFHLAAVDVAGNVGTTLHFGPVFASASPVTTYCTGKTNTLGCVPTVGSAGTPSMSGGTFNVLCSQVVNNKVGHLFWGYTPASVPFQGGTKCIAAPTSRTPNQLSGGSVPPANDCSGTFAFNFSTAYFASTTIGVGDTVYAQWWMRDPGAVANTGLSNAIQFTVCQ